MVLISQKERKNCKITKTVHVIITSTFSLFTGLNVSLTIPCILTTEQWFFLILEAES